ncbi:helicase-related protein, partial [Helicobacter fennelliae]
MRRAVAFYSTIRNSKFATENFKKISHDIECNHIDGTHNAYEKTQKLHWLAGEDIEEIEEDIEDDASESQASDPSCRVLCNAKCLTEGIDVPNLDAVAFFQPRGSVVDVVQAVGRAIRKAEGKSYGYVILPVVLTEDELQSIDSALKSKKFNVIWEALKALRSHDERLIDSARINEVVSVIGESGSGREAIEAT